MNDKRNNIEKNKRETGAALVTVLMISVLLTIACIALLSGVGSNSRNSTDVLSETKAYYAAESGLQTTINVLRNKPITYSQADQSGTLENANWLVYDYVNGTDRRVIVGDTVGTYTASSGTAYRILVSDPDHSKDKTIFSTVGTFQANNTGTISFPSTTAADRVTLTFTNVSNCLISFANNTHCSPNTADPNPLLSTLQIETFGSGHQLSWSANILINYSIISPRPGTRTIRGIISKASPTAPVVAAFNNNALLGADIKLCHTSTASPCSSFNQSITLPAAAAVTTIPIYMFTTALEPYRLKVLSTGFGPNGARKQLEAIIQKNFFNDSSPSAPFQTPNPGQGMVFNPGNSSTFSISGVDSASGISVPSIAVTDQSGLTAVLNGIPNNNNNINPPPAIVTDTPDWMATPQNLDAMVSKLRTTAQNSGRYFVNPSQNLNNVGNYTTGTGITFCEGDCTAGVDGGGILVVTGQLRNVGGFDFKGLIIVTGAEGWLRNGGGGGQIVGNVVIAPYTAADLVSNTYSLPPKYVVTGSGASGILYNEINFDQTLNGTTAISDFMIGFAEK